MIGRYIYITAAAVSPRCDTLLLCRRRRHHMSSLSYLHTSYVVCCIVRASSSPLHPSAVCIREVFLEQVGGIGALLRVADVTPTASEDRNRHTRASALCGTPHVVEKRMMMVMVTISSSRRRQAGRQAHTYYLRQSSSSPIARSSKPNSRNSSSVVCFQTTNRHHHETINHRSVGVRGVVWMDTCCCSPGYDRL